VWNKVSHPSDALKKLLGELSVGGRSQPDIEYGSEKAGGHLLFSTSPGRAIAESLGEEDEAVRPRDWRQEPGASLVIDPVDEPLRGWGQKTGVLCGWASCEDGRQGLLRFSTAHRESLERCREVFRDLGKRGLRPPATLTTAGASGLRQAIEAVWPKALRIGWWLPKRQNLHNKCQPQPDRR